VGFSVKAAVLTLIFGAVVAGAFALHRLQPQAHKTCNYKNWAAPCHTSGWHVDWTDVTAFAIVLGASVAAGLIAGNRHKRKMSASSPQSHRA